MIAYASRVLNKAECNYSAIQRECLAAVYGMKQFRQYLFGQQFELWTDHNLVVKLKVGGNAETLGTGSAGVQFYCCIPQRQSEHQC